MMRTLHRMTLKALPAPFLGAFATLLVLLLLQFLMRYLPELVGKGIPLEAIAELIFYNLAYMVVLAVPMAVLVATLLVYGQLAESRAYMVIKSAGISIPQLLWPTLLVGALLMTAMTYFNHNVLPEANYRARNLWEAIRKKKPGFALQPGVFYEGIEGYAIRAGRMARGDANRLYDLVIFDYTEGNRFRREIVARRGRLVPLENGRRIDLILEEGTIHRRIPPLVSEPEDRYERLRFAIYRISFDLSAFAFQRVGPEQRRRTDRTMKTSAMWALVDSLRQRHARQVETTFGLIATLGVPPELLKKSTGTPAFWQHPPAHRLALRGLTPAQQRKLYEQALYHARTTRSDLEAAQTQMRWLRERINRYLVEIHKKYAIAVACLIFVLIGAPLGLSIRRGGLGMAAGLSAAIFLFYWITLVQGEKLADRGLMDPWLAMWLANLLTGLLGLYLTLRVTLDIHVIGWRGLMALLFRRHPS